MKYYQQVHQRWCNMEKSKFRPLRSAIKCLLLSTYPFISFLLFVFFNYIISFFQTCRTSCWFRTNKPERETLYSIPRMFKVQQEEKLNQNNYCQIVLNSSIGRVYIKIHKEYIRTRIFENSSDRQVITDSLPPK